VIKAIYFENIKNNAHPFWRYCIDWKHL